MKQWHWSQNGTWDLSKVHSIPTSAIVETVKISFGTGKNFFVNISNSNFVLQNEKGSGVFIIPGLENYQFHGEPLNQVWSWATTRVSHDNPNLIMNWFDPISQDSGSIELISSQTEKKTKPEEGELIMKVGVNPYKRIINQNQSFSGKKNFDAYVADKLSASEKDEFIRSDASVILDSDPKELVEVSENAILLQKGIVYSLGFINGRPLQAMLLSNGGIDTNFNPRFIGPVTGDEELTDEQKRALELFKSFTHKEHEEAGRRTSVFAALSQLAEGIRDPASINHSSTFRYFEEFAEYIHLDTSKAFFLNGVKYVYDNRSLELIEK